MPPRIPCITNIAQKCIILMQKPLSVKKKKKTHFNCMRHKNKIDQCRLTCKYKQIKNTQGVNSCLSPPSTCGHMYILYICVCVCVCVVVIYPSVFNLYRYGTYV